MMQRIHGMVIVAVRRGAVDGHLVRTGSGVKAATYYGDDSFDRAVLCARGRRAGPGRPAAGFFTPLKNDVKSLLSR